jgi:hypothetical protein
VARRGQGKSYPFRYLQFGCVYLPYGRKKLLDARALFIKGYVGAELLIQDVEDAHSCVSSPGNK